jgi:hypothetical protein
VGSLDEVERTALIRTMEKCAVKVHNNEYTAWLSQSFRTEGRLGKVLTRGIWDASRCFARCFRRGIRAARLLLLNRGLIRRLGTCGNAIDVVSMKELIIHPAGRTLVEEEASLVQVGLSWGPWAHS